MKKLIASLREKPESHKRRVAYGTSAVITLVIAGVWATSFQYFNGTGITKAEVAKANTDNSPLNVLKRGAASAYEAITGSHVEFVKGESDSSASGTLEYVPEAVPVQASTSTSNTDNQFNN
ncbi:MAG: hypothetical protein WC629_00745 [Candidatus Paceibacterota bacterium]|jgi:hypothetical protein